jgi:hypothetical protein
MAASQLPAHSFLLPCLAVLHVPHAAMLTVHCHFPIGSQRTSTFCISDTHFIHSATCVKVVVVIEQSAQGIGYLLPVDAVLCTGTV